MIRQLNNHGFKDQTRTTRFSGLDFFSSKDVNGVGKSAVLEAFKLALMGEIPGRAKNVEDILQFTSFDEMKIEILADTRQGRVTVERRFLRHAPRGEKRPVRINQVARKYEEGNQWIRSHIGAASISFDPFEFLNLSDSKKREWIIAHSPESQHVSRDGLYVLILAGMVEKYLGSGIVHSLLTSLGLASLDEILEVRDANELLPLKDRLIEVFHGREPRFRDLTGNTLDEVFHCWSPSRSAGQNNNAMLAHLKSESSRLKKAVREQTGVLSCMKPEPKNDVKTPSPEIPDLKEEIHCLDEKIEDLERKIQRVKIGSVEKARKDRRISFLQESISRLADKLNGETNESLEKTREQLLEKLVDARELQEERNRLNRSLTRWSSDLRDCEASLTRLSGELKLKRDKQENLASSHFTCPVAREIYCDTDMNPYRGILEKEIESLTLEEVEAGRSCTAVQKKADDCRRQAEALAGELAARLAGNLEIQREINLLEKRIQADAEETAKARGMVKVYREEWRLLESGPDPVNIREGEMEALEKQKLALKIRKDEIQKTLDEQLRRQGQMGVLSELREKQKQWRWELEIVKQMAELIGGIQREMASRISAALEAEVNDALKLIDGDYDFTLDLDGGQFEMGWNRDGRIIPFKTINSAHFIIFIAPFLAALMNRLARTREKYGLPTLKALCVEAECLTPGNLKALLGGLAKIKEQGAIDNVLVAHYHSLRDPEKLSGFEEHILDGAGSQALA